MSNSWRYKLRDAADLVQIIVLFSMAMGWIGDIYVWKDHTAGLQAQIDHLRSEIDELKTRFENNEIILAVLRSKVK